MHSSCADDRHSTLVTVVILDTELNKIHFNSDYSTYYWTEEHGACDCRRYPSGSSEIRLCGAGRFKIIEVAPLLEGYSLKDFN